MGMPVTIEVSDRQINKSTNGHLNKVFNYLKWVDSTFSPFKPTSEVSKFNLHKKYSDDLRNILKLAEQTKKETGGFFDVFSPNGKLDPSGIVKGWAIWEASKILKEEGHKRFFVDIAGDAEIVGKNWKWGIRNPFKSSEIIKTFQLSNCGIATSGTSERGDHIYNPLTKKAVTTEVVSLTVIAKNVYEADRFATAAFAMGRNGINFIENRKDLEGYMVDKHGIATMTSGFN